jgi:peptide/nickel transport system permease protein
MKTLKRVLWRLFIGLIVLLGANTLTFVVAHSTGGDIALSAAGGLNSSPTAEVLARIRSDYGLDLPLRVQYFRYLRRLVHGDLGESYRLRIPVASAIREQLPATASLAIAAGVLSLIFAIPTALLTARRSNSIRMLSSGVELVVSSMPPFVVGLMLLLAFSIVFPIFPSAGSHGWRSLVLPTLALALPISCFLAQVLRQEIEEILEQPFITMARARGLSEIGVRFGHALRHALIPLLTISGYVFATLLGGAVVTEALFARQGIGRLMVDATSNKDVPIVLGVTLIATASYVIVNLLVDLASVLVDPRLQPN